MKVYFANLNFADLGFGEIDQMAKWQIGEILFFVTRKNQRNLARKMVKFRKICEILFCGENEKNKLFREIPIPDWSDRQNVTDVYLAFFFFLVARPLRKLLFLRLPEGANGRYFFFKTYYSTIYTFYRYTYKIQNLSSEKYKYFDWTNFHISSLFLSISWFTTILLNISGDIKYTYYRYSDKM